ncbi:M20/M25/M40 family metallo-hydrolase [Chungangia koreensis]|uniref:M20/M25/M40 family metallo-hydrolase n=1 Tax=Chungangia koreensis TaxID=752657 RepID=UPI00366E6702
MKDLYEYIDQHRDQYISWLQEGCRQPSVSTQFRGIDEMAAMVEGYLLKLNAEVQIVPTGRHPVVYGKILSDKEKTLSFYNHYDVQPEDPIELWDYPPFGAEIHDGKLFARGVADNKGNLFARIAAIHAYQQVYGELPVNIKFFVDGEEEFGSIYTHHAIENAPDIIETDGYIWESGYKTPDGALSIRLGLKGMLYIELRAKGANTDLHSSNAAIIENPAWRLVWALNTLKGTDERVKIEGFYDRVDQPSELEKQMLANMPLHEKEMLKNLELESFLLNLDGDELKEKFIFQPTCTICGIYSGYTGEGSKTVLPSEAKVKIDFRLVPDQDPDEIIVLLRKHLDKHGFEDITIHKISGKKAAKTDPGDPLAKVAIKEAEKFYGKPPQIFSMSPGTGPMYKLAAQYNIPAVSFGVGYEDSRIHAPNENIRIEDFIEGIKFICTVMHEYSLVNKGISVG